MYLLNIKYFILVLYFKYIITLLLFLELFKESGVFTPGLTYSEYIILCLFGLTDLF